MHKLGVEIIPYVRLCAADEETVYLQNITSDEPVICEGVDTLVTFLGHVTDTALERAVHSLDCAVYLTGDCPGDCLSPRTAEEVILEGMRAAVAIV